MDITKLAITGGILFAAYKFAPSQLVKGGVLAVTAVIVAKHVPYVQDYLA